MSFGGAAAAGGSRRGLPPAGGAIRGMVVSLVQELRLEVKMLSSPVTHLQLEVVEAALQDDVGAVP